MSYEPSLRGTERNQVQRMGEADRGQLERAINDTKRHIDEIG
jgi:hypothetical protein